MKDLRPSRIARIAVTAVALPAVLILAVAPPASAASVPEITRVSTATGGAQASGGSWSAAISSDGRYVAFDSDATDLVTGDTNGTSDVFLTDTATGITTRVSTATGGVQASGGGSFGAAISANGRYVAYTSGTNDLVVGDTNGDLDIFLTDTITGTTTRVSAATGGVQATGDSYGASISANGRYVAYYSAAADLVAGDTNGTYDVFVTDTTTGTTTLVSAAAGGGPAFGGSYFPALSADGRYIAYESDADNLILNDSNTRTDIFLTDTATGTTTRVSTATGGAQANGISFSADVSATGRYVTYSSSAPDLVAADTNSVDDVFLTDTATGITTRVSTATGGVQTTDHSYNPSISSDGRYVAYDSVAAELVADDTNGTSDVFLTDTTAATTTRVSTATGGAQGTTDSFSPAISADGRYVAYHSNASELVAGDTNGVSDVFLYDSGVVAAAAPALAATGFDPTWLLVLAALLMAIGIVATRTRARS